VRLVELARHEPPEAVVLVRGNEASLEQGHFERDSTAPDQALGWSGHVFFV
jgi:hypothetical protein